MRIDVVTIFPEMFRSPLEYSILKRAHDAGLLEVICHNLRDYATDRHRTVDDTPFGGGPGMVMKPEPFFLAVETIVATSPPPGPGRILLTSPRGQRFDQAFACELAAEDQFIILCGRYEGVDERVHQHLATDEVSLGDFILTGGELAALCIIDATARLVPGVVGKEESVREETFSGCLLEYPQFTRPANFRGWRVPDVLLSGNHEEIRRWRRRQALELTLALRPDLFRICSFTDEDRELLGWQEKPKRRRRAEHLPPGPEGASRE
ncbi:MAG: tRNA (guanosine(37)-N1)-methyltransferase TrmD [Armatimonadetes bacterium]|nr:tRNA (guanosine(37)-N1)-methyltransferase TrmD [Armatimonadota bacterium]